MALSHIARLHADEIRNHDWSDAPFRIDRAGHDRADDGGRGEQLTETQTDRIRMNVMWVTAQVLGFQDPNFDVYEFAEACGVETRTRTGRVDGGIQAGVRLLNGRYARPGTRDYDDRY
ncbi:hypothetical protein IX27_18520 [Streptomyces sp. JS01]|uniref:hypothetical protein n=1 Tax=Streptomyces sp. JS01 TaxID=1525753 RepID=UPI000504FE6D|nr:hypothetical protein [Streptomyces sp. JS01]KFK87882.1 hypothetical protein IX27_18520 [Streptomyces sp. JS01]